MPYGISRFLSTILAVTLLFHTFARGQDQPTVGNVRVAGSVNSWEETARKVQPRAKLLVITIAHPTRRAVCRVRSVANEQLVCKGQFGGSRVYKLQEIAALIVPGDTALQTRLWIGFNAAAGLAAWGTYVLAPTCIPCAAATAFAAFAFVSFAFAVGYSDDQPDSLIYLAPNQQVQYSKDRRTIGLKSLPSRG